MEKIVEFTGAFDKRDPNPTKNYGIHGVEVRFVLKGKLGATQFLIFTNWHLPHVQKELDNRHNDHDHCHPMAVDLGYHSPIPQYEGMEPINDCPYLDGKPCYYDGSGLAAEDLYQIFLREGDKAVWFRLEKNYLSLFGKLE